ncbi:MAG: hypothetical protein JW751_14690 [Polyangiaceae bacterium]|nr:hypothetical protein [Polyangiaceae bacterium]
MGRHRGWGLRVGAPLLAVGLLAPLLHAEPPADPTGVPPSEESGPLTAEPTTPALAPTPIPVATPPATATTARPVFAPATAPAPVAYPTPTGPADYGFEASWAPVLVCNGEPLESLPSTLPYRRGDPVPSCYHPWFRERLGLIITGSVAFVASYGYAVAAAPVDRRLSALYVPLVGPLVAAATVSESPARDGAPMELDPDNLALLAFVQWASAGLAAVGWAIRREVLIRNDLYPQPPLASNARGNSPLRTHGGRASRPGPRVSWDLFAVPGPRGGEFRLMGAF